MTPRKTSKPPSWPYYYGWVIVTLAITTSLFSVGVVFYTHGVFRVYLVRDFGFTPGEAMDVYKWYIGAVAIYSFFLVPRLMERLSSKGTILFGCSLLTAGLLALSFSPNKLFFFAIFGGVVSLGTVCMGSIPSQSAIAYWFDRRRAQALSLAATGVTAGGILNVPLAGWLIEKYGWRTAYQIFAGIVFLAGCPLILWLWKDRPEEIGLTGEPPESSAAHHAPAPPVAEHPPLSNRALLSHGVFVKLAISLGLASTGWSIILQSLVSDFLDQGYSTAQATFLMSILMWVILVGKPLYGRLGDRIDLKWGILWAIVLQLVGSACFVLSRMEHPFSFAFGSGTADGPLLVALLTFGVGVGGCQPLYSAYNAELLGRSNFARAAGVTVPIITGCQLLGYQLSAYLLDRPNGFLWMWLSMGVAYVLSLAVIGVVPRSDTVGKPHVIPHAEAGVAPATIIGELIAEEKAK
ncbi:MAG: MFS transporter [Bdellovibrionota bacterium]